MCNLKHIPSKYNKKKQTYRELLIVVTSREEGQYWGGGEEVQTTGYKTGSRMYCKSQGI